MSDSARRLASLAAAGAILLLSALFAFAAIAGWTETRATIDRTGMETQSAPAADAARYLIPGGTRAEASADLQARVNAAARGANVSLTRVRIIPEDSDDPARLIVETEAEGATGELARFLHVLESQPPALVVTEARLSPAQAGSNRQRLEARIVARRRPGAAP